MARLLAFNWMEVHLAEHCNLRCRSCTHHSPYLDPAFYPVSEFKEDILAFSKAARLNMLKFVGGEPLLNRDIVSYLQAAKMAKVARILCVVTNGILLREMTDDFFRMVNRIEVSLYPALHHVSTPIRECLTSKSSQFGFVFDIVKWNHFYNLETEGPLSEKDAKYSYDHCARRLQSPFMNRGYFYKCFRPATTLAYLRNRGVTKELPEFALTDGISLHEPRLIERMRDYMQSSTPLQSCSHCRLGFKRYDRTWYSKIRDILPQRLRIERLAYRYNRVIPLYYALRRAIGRSWNDVQHPQGIPIHPHQLMSACECQPRTNCLPIVKQNGVAAAPEADHIIESHRQES